MMIGRREILYLSVFVSLWICNEGFHADDSWDFLIFSQKWPITFCISYTDQMPLRTCLLPKNKLHWVIHGVWPNKLNEIGPFYCNTSAKYDESKIEPLKSKLVELWPNLEGGHSVDSLWQHEWEKHGTCSLDLEPLNTEFKYFHRGILLYNSLNMTWLLNSVKIIPEAVKEYSVQHIINELKNELGVTVYVQCIQKKHTEKHYLSEIRLCTDKNFRLIDCHLYQNSLTNCPSDESIIYPKDIGSIEHLDAFEYDNINW